MCKNCIAHIDFLLDRYLSPIASDMFNRMNYTLNHLHRIEIGLFLHELEAYSGADLYLTI